MRKQKGFSLIELLIVVAIILIIAAIAIPNLLRSRMAANEASAVGSLRTVNTAEVTYSSAYPNVGFAQALGNLGGNSTACAAGTAPTTATACIIDNVLATGSKSGYLITATGSASGTMYPTYYSTAMPITVGTTGTRGFCSDQSGVIYFEINGSNAIGSDSTCIGLTALQ